MFDFHHHFKTKEGIYNVDLGQSPPEMPFSVGLHPKDIQPDFEEQLAWVRETSRHSLCWAIGECGLDAGVKVEEAWQEQVFESQILWANEIQKPVIIHCVRRFSGLLKFQKIARVPLIVHGFNKKRSVAEELLQKGFYLSFGKALLYNEALQETARAVPIEKMFLETDVWEGRVDEVYKLLARLKCVAVEEVERRLKINANEVFLKT